jgi:staphylococcal nuclease domain-containing protein 1
VRHSFFTNDIFRVFSTVMLLSCRRHGVCRPSHNTLLSVPHGNVLGPSWLFSSGRELTQPALCSAVCLPHVGLVEAVLNGSTLRLTLLPERTPVTVTLAGVQCPSMGKRPPAAAAPAAAPEANGSAPEANGTANGNGAAPAAVTAATIAASGVSAAAPGGAEPLSREAKWFTESRVLNREVSQVFLPCACSS